MRVAMTEDLPVGSTGTEKYYFDSLYQLNRADYPDGHRDDWTYDRIGNRLSAATYVPGTEPILRNYSYYPNGHGGNSQLLQSDGVNSYTWDPNGNLFTKTGSDGLHSYTWNSRNLLSTISAPGLNAAYGYDFLSRCASSMVNSLGTSYEYFGLDLIRQTNASTTENLFGTDIDEILATRIAGTDYFYASDGHGSNRQILDSLGQLQNQYSYDAWGTPRMIATGIPNTFLFTGREAAEDGLQNFRMRNYDPSLGRFVSEDPLRFAAGEPGFYRFPFGDPVNMSDPLGLWGLENLPDSVLDRLADIPEGTVDTLQDVGNYAAGMGDNLTLGLTGKVRDVLGDSGMVNKCSGAYSAGEWSGVALSTAIGAGGLPAGLRGLSNGAKGAIGEGLSVAENTLRGSRLVGRQVSGGGLGLSTIFDGVWQSRSGATYYVESKFGTSSLSRAQRAAARALGDAYRVERWDYPFFGRVGGYLGAGSGAASAMSGSNCGCD